MLDQFKKTIQRNLLKYSAGHAITCPKCGNIAGYRAWVIWESPSGQHGAHCADCHREILAKIHDDKPHSYLLSIGWKIDTLVNFEKKPKAKKPAYPQKPGKALDTFLRKDIAKGFKANGYHAKADRFFPGIVHSSNRPLVVNEDGQWSNAQITADYVRAFCRLNNLTV